MNDAQKIAECFESIYRAAMQINDILHVNDELNESVPTNWPLHLSADEFAAECWAMVEHYKALS